MIPAQLLSDTPANVLSVVPLLKRALPLIIGHQMVKFTVKPVESLSIGNFSLQLLMKFAITASVILLPGNKQNLFKN
jgi:hypothetical protein